VSDETFFKGFDDADEADDGEELQPELEDLERGEEVAGLDPWLPPPSEE
jgi:hypothetical protein